MKNPALIVSWLLSCAVAFGLGAVLINRTPEEVGASGDSRSVGPSLTTGGEAAKPGPKVPGMAASSTTSGDPFTTYVRDGIVAPDEMASLMKDVMSENDPIKRAELFSKLLAHLTPENALGAYEQLSKSASRFDFEKSRLLLTAWGRLDGKGAMTELMNRRNAQEDDGGRGRGRGRGGFGGRGGRGGGGRGGDTMEMMSVLSGWATADTKEATTYLEEVEGLEDRQKTALSAGIVQGLLVNGVSEAMDYVSALPKDDQVREWMMGSITREVLEDGVDAASTWATSITDPKLREGALNEVAERYVQDDLEGAKEWVSGFAGESYSESAVREVAEALAATEPASALQWAETLPESAQPAVYDETFSDWARENPTAASEYLNSMDASPAKDQAINGFATNVAREDPQMAIDWAGTISDAEARTETLTSVARSWYFRDQTAASAWLETSGLPVESIEKVTAEPQWGDRIRGGRRR